MPLVGGEELGRLAGKRSQKDCGGKLPSTIIFYESVSIFSSYVMRGILCVTLDGQILGRWVFVVDVTRTVVSVTGVVGLPHS